MTRAPEQPSEKPWSVPVALQEAPETGRSFTLVADERTREAVAKLAGLRSLTRLEAQFEVTPRGRDGLHVAGTISATVGQDCVVTLEPIENEIEEQVDLVFAPPAAPTIGDEGGEPVEGTPPETPEPPAGSSARLGARAE